MYLSEFFANKLKKLGFQRTYYVNEIAPFDVFQYNEQEWVIGGRILPEENLLAKSVIYHEGTWLPNSYDLIKWITDHGYTFNLEFKGIGLGFVLRIKDENQNEFIVKGGTLEVTFFKAIERILEQKT